MAEIYSRQYVLAVDNSAVGMETTAGDVGCESGERKIDFSCRMESGVVELGGNGVSRAK